MSNATCSVAICQRPAAARGWCKQHHKRWLRTGDIQADVPFQVKPAVRPPGICAIPACDRPRRNKDWCTMHHARWKRHGDATWESPSKSPTCSIVDCDNRRSSRGWCKSHYEKWRKYGDPLAMPPSKRQRVRVCSVDHCDRRHQAKGFCRSHYQKWRLYGDPLAVKNGRTVHYCSVDDCEEQINDKVTMMCKTHSWRMNRHGDPLWDAKASRRDGNTSTCCRCGETKHVDLFCSAPSGVNGIGTVCKACKKTYDAEYRKTHREQRREANRRRRAIINGNDAEVVDVDALWAKTNGDCELCSDPVDPSLVYPNPMSPSLDHIKQIHHRGSHTLANTRITHLICNISRKRNETV